MTVQERVRALKAELDAIPRTGDTKEVAMLLGVTTRLMFTLVGELEQRVRHVEDILLAFATQQRETIQ